MAENDIYDSQGKNERFQQNLDELLNKPKTNIQVYYCKNPAILKTA